MNPDTLETTVDDAVAVVTLARPAQRNAVNRPLAEALDAAFARLDADPGVRGIILTGGPRFFSAGTDLHEDASPATPDGGEYGFIRRQRSTPLIAAVEGFALGGGFEMVLACDLVVAAEDAVFGLPEVKRGVIANCGALFRAPHALPPHIATQLLLTGEPVAASRAHAWGLVNVLAAPGETLQAARTLAASIAQNSPAAVGETLGALRDAREAAERDLWPLTDAAAARTAVSADRAEGIAAFFDKRPPRWTEPGGVTGSDGGD